MVAGTSGALNLVMDKSAKTGVAMEEIGDVNGEQVEKRARDQQLIEFVRTGVAGVGFAMAVVGIWGDGSH